MEGSSRLAAHVAKREDLLHILSFFPPKGPDSLEDPKALHLHSVDREFLPPPMLLIAFWRRTGRELQAKGRSWLLFPGRFLWSPVGVNVEGVGHWEEAGEG